DHVVVEPGLARPAAVLLLAPSRDGDDQDRASARLRANAPRRLVAVDPGEPEVEQDDVGGERERLVHGAQTVVDGARLVSRELEQRRERRGGVDVVVDPEDPPQLAVAGRGDPAERGGAAGRHAALRERPPKLGAPAEPVAPRLDAPAVHLDEAADEREPDPQTAAGPGKTLVELREHLEDAFPLLGRESDSLVADRDLDPAGPRRRRESDRASRIRELAGVVQEVREDLRDAHGIRPQEDRLL